MKAAFYTLLVTGFVACQMFGIGKTLERVGTWAHPSMIAGTVLGVAILGLTVAFAAGFRPQMLATDRSMLIALAALIAAKVGVALATAATAAMARS
jgi:hypothetical protein